MVGRRRESGTGRAGLSRRHWAAVAAGEIEDNGQRRPTWQHWLATGLALGVLAGAALGIDSVLVEPRRLQYRRHKVSWAGLPVEFDGLSVLHLSDFHYVPRDRWLRARLGDLARQTSEAPPDLIALTGDFVEWDEDAPALAALLGALHSRLGSFAVLGNHDYGNAFDPPDKEQHSLLNRAAEIVGGPLQRYFERPAKAGGNRIDAVVTALEDAGIVVLRNTAVRLVVDGEPLWVGGVDEPHQHRNDAAAVCAAVPLGEPLLLLAHSPEVVEQRLAHRPGLILAGHTHGGQVRLPLLPPLVTHTRISLPAYQGMIATSSGPMHISAGLGASVPLRFRCPPEVTTLVLQAVPPGTSDHRLRDSAVISPSVPLAAGQPPVEGVELLVGGKEDG